MQDLRSLTIDELKALCEELGFSKFKAKEIYKFIHCRLIKDLSELTTIKKAERNILTQKFTLSTLKPLKIEKGEKTLKAAFELEDGKIIEAVYMNVSSDRKTVCVSSQVGCGIKCQFCATGAIGFQRNLTVAEIVNQVYFFAREHTITNLVFMGMGEPFLNYDNVLKACHILNNENGLNIAARKIVISTIGIIPSIRQFISEPNQFRLAWSLVSPIDEMRQNLVPFKGLPTVKRTVRALQDYQEAKKRRITIEYVVLKGINDNERSLKELVNISHELDCNINLIPYNPVPNDIFESGDASEVFDKLKILDKNINVTIRASLGKEISAACGQLAGKPHIIN